MKYLYLITKTISYALSIAATALVMYYSYNLIVCNTLSKNDYICIGIICAFYAIDLMTNIIEGEKSLPIKFIIKVTNQLKK